MVRTSWLVPIALVAAAGCSRRGATDRAGRDAAPSPVPSMPGTRVVELTHPAALFEDVVVLPAFDGIELLAAGDGKAAAGADHGGNGVIVLHLRLEKLELRCFPHLLT